MDVKNLMPGVNFTDDITPEDFIDVMNIAVPEGPSDYTDMLDTIILNTDGSRNPLDTFTIDSDGLKDYGFECCLRAMDRLYNFSYCIPDFEPATYVVPPLPVYSCHRGRNLWIDAFGLINFISFARHTRDHFFLVCAASLVDAVHNTLGKTRDGTSYLPGATKEEPTKGGLRAGKMFEVDSAGDSADCQDFLGIAMWMYGLNHLSLGMRNPLYNGYALQLATAVYPSFKKYRDDKSRFPRKLTIGLERIPSITKASRSHVITSLAATIIRDTQETALRLGRKGDIPLKREVRSLHQRLVQIRRERPGMLRCPDDVNAAGDHDRLFLDPNNLRTMALYLFIGHHSGDKSWGKLITRNATRAVGRFLSRRVNTLGSGTLDVPTLYPPSARMELFLMAAAKCHPPRPPLDADEPEYNDINSVLFYWRDQVENLISEFPGAYPDPAELYVMYVAAQMPSCLEFVVETDDE